MKSFLFFIEGFLAKIITGADDTLTHTPLLATFTKTKKGKLTFIFGMFISILILITISLFFAKLLQSISYQNIISAILLLVLAGFVYYSKHLRREKYAHWIKKKISKKSRRFVLFSMGLLVFFITGIDDLIVYSSLLHGVFLKQLLVVFGILFAAILEFIIILYFSRKLSKIKYIEKFTIIGLIVLAVLVGFKVF